MSQKRPSAWWKAGSLCLVASAIVGGLFVFRGCASSADSNVQRTIAAAPSARPQFEIPDFRDPEQEKRYLTAMVEGDRKSLELLSKALADAKSVPHADEAYLAELEREHAMRTGRVEAMEAARAKVRP